MIIFNTNKMNASEKKDMMSFFELMLVSQAIKQHKEIDKSFKGTAVDYELLREEECLLVTYADGRKFKYRNIDLGIDGMEVEKWS